MTLLDRLMSEYGWTIEYAMNVPLAQAFALFAAITVRNNNDLPGPDYIERELIEVLAEKAEKLKS